MYWLPLLRFETGIPRHDERAPSRFQDLNALVLNNAEPIKLACYVLPLVLALGCVYNLWLTARREANVMLARQLASQSQLLRTEILDLEPTALLAAESMERMALVDNDRAIRDVAALLPRRIWIAKRSFVEVNGAVAFSPDGRYVAAAGSAKKPGK